MKLAHSFIYKNIAISIKIDPISEIGYISYKDKFKSVTSKDIDYLKMLARRLIDTEDYGIIYYNMY